MEDIRQGSVAAFDAQFTNNQICKLKVLIRFLDPSMQRSIAVCIKFMELQYTLQLSRHPVHRVKSTLPGAVNEESDFDFDKVCDELLPYCDAREKQQFTQIRNMFQTMHSMQGMMEMMESMKELFPEGMGSGDGQGGFNPEMLAAMSSMFGGGDMDLGVMAEMFSGS